MLRVGFLVAGVVGFGFMQANDIPPEQVLIAIVPEWQLALEGFRKATEALSSINSR